MMADNDEYDEDELELIRKHRAKKAAAAKKAGRKVTVRGKHDSGAEYEFDLDGDEAERVIGRHRALWSDDDGPDDEGEGDEDGDGGTDGDGDQDGQGDAAADPAGGSGKAAAGGRARRPASGGGKTPAQPKRTSPYFKH